MLVEILVERGANVNKPGKEGLTGLHCAAGFGHLDVVKYLLARGTKPRADDDGETPDAYAARFGHVAVRAALKAAESDAGLEALKNEMLPGFSAEADRRRTVERARAALEEGRLQAEERARRAAEREAKALEELRQHRESVRERRRSIGLPMPAVDRPLSSRLL